MVGGKTRKPGGVCWVVVVAALLGLGGHAGHAAAGYIDQEVDVSGFTSAGPDLSDAGPHGQEFVPSVAEHVGVTLFLNAVPAQMPAATTVSVQLRSGSITGPVVAGSEVTLSVLAGALTGNGDTWSSLLLTTPDGAPQPLAPMTFLFDVPVTLSPGQLYVLEVTADGPVHWTATPGNAFEDPYSAGQAIIDGQLQNAFVDHVDGNGNVLATIETYVDLGFQTLVAADLAAAVPEPSSLLLVIGVCVAAVVARPRSCGG